MSGVMKFSLTVTGLLIFSQLVLISSSTSSDKQYQFLDVSASLQHARHVLSPSFAHTTPTTTTSHPLRSSALSLSLISRSSLSSNSGDTITNYTSLTLSRLARDEAHVHFLLSKLSLSLSKHSNVESPVISGLNHHMSGEYFARIGVGTPAAEFYIVIDTGSDINWLQCRPCVHCYPQSDPIFNPSASSTYAHLSCLSRRCFALDAPACLAGRCLYQVLYGDASFTAGEFAAETISFGSSSGSVPNVAIGCGHSNGGLFSGAAGLLGLGGGALSLTSQIKATSFSYCLVNRDSNASSTLDFNSTQPADSVEAPLLTNSFADTFRYVGLSGISVGGEPVKFPSSLFEIGVDGSGGVIVDSGTTVSRLRKEVYVPVRDAFRNMSRNLSYAGDFFLFDTCYHLSSLSEVRVPALSFQFTGGKTVELPASNYMMPVDSSSSKFCFAFAGTLGPLSIIGNVQQQGMRITFDLANKYIGFSPNKC